MFTSELHASGVKFKQGFVLARAPYLGPNDKPIFIEVDDTGGEVSEIGEAHGPLDGAYPFSAQIYKAEVVKYKEFLQANRNGIARGAEILSNVGVGGANEYLSHCNSQTISELSSSSPPAQVGYSTVNACPIIPPSIKSVVIRASQTIRNRSQLDPDDGAIIYKSPINLSGADASDIAITDLSVLLNPKGKRIPSHLYKNTVTYKWAYFGPPVPPRSPSTGPNVPRADLVPRVLSPIKNVAMVSIGVDNKTRTNEYGEYHIAYKAYPCTCSAQGYDTRISAQIPYQHFNPKRDKPFGTYIVGRDYYDSCGGPPICPLTGSLAAVSTYTSLLNIHSARADDFGRTDLYVDAAMLAGPAEIIDASTQLGVSLGITEYYQDQQMFTPMVEEELDLDGDRRTDTAVLRQDGYVHVYLNGRVATQGDADLRRLPDAMPDFNDRGILKSISQADLEKTDLYVYRESTGELIMERIGLQGTELTAYNDLSTNDDGTAGFFYNFLIRGPRIQADTATRSLDQWWTNAGIKQTLVNQNQANFLRKGEIVRIVAINRPTGYIGTVTAPMELGTTNRGTSDGGTSLSVPLGEMKLYPPNLKIEAKRKSITQLGLTAGEVNEYLIGSEGAGTIDDEFIEITTDWRDQDGSPLPESLPGYSALLAKIVSDRNINKDGACSSQLDNFEIRPGRKLQLLKLKTGCDLSKEHYYMYACGHNLASDSRSQCYEFENGKRPKYYTPVKVPIYDELATRKARNGYDYSSEDRLINSSNSDKPEPVFRWHYRPEMQFSVYDFNLNRLTVADTDPNLMGVVDPPTQIDLTQRDGFSDVFTSGIDVIELFYGLAGNTSEILPAYSERELILSIGGQETVVTLGSNGNIIFDNPEYLSLLSPTDYLFISLYSSNDSANILWQYSISDLIVASSDIPDSRDNQSFLIYSQDIKTTDGKSLPLNSNNEQANFKLNLTYPLKKGDTFQWEISVPDVTKYGHFTLEGNNVPIPRGGQANTDYAQWQSPILSYDERHFRRMEFRPKPPDPIHLTGAYKRNKRGSCTSFSSGSGGTCLVDIGLRNPQYTYEVKATVTGSYGNVVYEKMIKMDHKDIIRQEYVNHSRLPNTPKMTEADPVPLRPDLKLPVASTNFTSTMGCDINCLDRIAANYTRTNASPGYTYRDPLVYAEAIRAQYVLVQANTTPILTSGWRNPERNEAIGSASANSDHQWGRALDFDIRPTIVEGIYDVNSPDLAAGNWCQLATAAYNVGNVSQILVENTAGARNPRTPLTGRRTPSIYHEYSGTQAACTTAVRNRIEQCLLNFPVADRAVFRNRRACSPNHVHAAQIR